MKNIPSVQKIRIPNIELMMQRPKNGIERSPLKVESLETNWIGPAKKNLDIPKAEEKMLNRKVIRVKAELKSWKYGIVEPSSFFG